MLMATLEMDEKSVAREIEKIHTDYASIIQYNDENSLSQIKDKKYSDSILNYTGDILLVGINYDKDSKKHECMIEKYQKE